MYSAESHRDYGRERHTDLVRAASRRDQALELALVRDEERRTFLARAWQRRFGRPAPRTSPATA